MIQFCKRLYFYIVAVDDVDLDLKSKFNRKASTVRTVEDVQQPFLKQCLEDSFKRCDF